jgi:hypothetical protein
MSTPIRKYPRTRHLAGSNLQSGDHDLETVPFAALRGRHVVVEEKVDGANCAISFDASASLRLQSRGHYLTGGPRERHFNLFKQWAAAHEDRFFDALGDRHVLYGEWLYAKHTLFYDALPHYFMEFDVLDTESGEFLDTAGRSRLLAGLPIVPVRVLFEGEVDREEELHALVGRSHFMTPSLAENLHHACDRYGLDARQVSAHTDLTGLMEGLYIKIETAGRVEDRLKFIRLGFINTIVQSETHWLDRPILPNQLAPGVDLFADEGGMS